ncbi:MAG: domain S-box [Bacteroidetes bacterium]|nr:domain S-box [Bacteroidota bacterium]
MKNSTAQSLALQNLLAVDTDRSQIQINPYTADQRVKLKWIGPDPISSKTEEKLTLEERFAKNCPDILCTIDADCRFVDISVASELVLGYAPKEMGGKLISEFIIPQDIEKTIQAVVSVMAGHGFCNFENRQINKAGETIHMSWSARWCADDELIYCVGRDDRDKKAVELELHKLNESLELKIKERTDQLEHSMKELEAFSYSVSHDLRAPLRIINGYARLLTGQLKNSPDADSIEFLDAIIDSTKYMGQLIDDLLNLSRLDKEAVNLMEVNMDYMSRLVLQNMQNEDPTITKNVVIHELKSVQCDSSLIKQVWINLISNAIKYSKKTNNPKIEIGSYETDSTVVYYVKDNGAGFDMKFAAKLFGVFVRLHNRTEFEGTGVGLALVNRIVTKHGGKVWANSKVDEGAVFYFSLPKMAADIA